MRLTHLHLRHFRNHADSRFDFCDGTNVLVGGNGQGKTNVIEAISYLCFTKSFFAGSDTLAVRFGEERFSIGSSLCSDGGTAYDVHVDYSAPEAEKQYSINRHRIEPLSSAVGKFPVVICSPEHAPITSAGPAERRKFIDLVISQSSANYVRHLIEYRKVLRQRNRVLLDMKLSRNGDPSILNPWNEQLVVHGSYVMARRRDFVREFAPYITDGYRRLIQSGEEPAMVYESSPPGVGDTADEAAIRDLFIAELGKREAEELRLGTTLTGPHRDEFPMTINGLDIRSFASQGQHKTFLIALKIGEFYYLRERCDETPLVLLDDVFSELDEDRSAKLLDFLGVLSQSFITTTHPGWTGSSASIRYFTIAAGTVTGMPEAAA